jgi:hypothetical protein
MFVYSRFRRGGAMKSQQAWERNASEEKIAKWFENEPKVSFEKITKEASRDLVQKFSALADKLLVDEVLK